jgi:hypothetical protein
LTSQTVHTLNFDLNEYWRCANWYGSKSSQLFTSTYDVPGFADRAFMGEMILGDPKNDCPIFITGMYVLIANNAESMIQETGGHGLIPFFFLGLVTLKRITHVHIFN